MPQTAFTLTEDQARGLLSRLGHVSIVGITATGGTNANFRVVTRSHGTFHLKCHTAFWYKSDPDADFAAERAAAVQQILRGRGLLANHSWVDASKAIVPHSVFVGLEIPGQDGLTAWWHATADGRDSLLAALGSYTRRLHAIEFSARGTVGPAHAAAAGADGVVPPVPARNWVRDPAMQYLFRPEVLQRNAQAMLATRVEQGLVPKDAGAALAPYLAQVAQTLAPDYTPPRLTVGNYHISHFLAEPAGDGWRINGFCDYEDVSAGDPVADLVEMELLFLPHAKESGWRQAFFQGYGSWPDFQRHKMRLLCHLLYHVDGYDKRVVPDRPWLARRWLQLLDAGSWNELIWFPPAGHGR